jgi:hypothetical protein
MKPIVGCFFRWLASLALLLLSRTQAVSAQTLGGQPSYQATGLRTVIKAQPNSALVRVRYESNNPGPVCLELLNDKGGVVYTERKQETHFVGNYDFASLPAGDYALHVSTSGFHHVEAVRLHRANNSTATVQVIRLTAVQTASQSALRELAHPETSGERAVSLPQGGGGRAGTAGQTVSSVALHTRRQERELYRRYRERIEDQPVLMPVF